VLTIVLVKMTLLVIVAYIVATALRRASSGLRHLLWLATLVGIVLLPGAATWRPLRLAVLPAAPVVVHSAAGHPAVATDTPTSAPDLILDAAAHAAPTVRTGASTSIHISWVWVLGALWAIGAIILLGRLVHGIWTVRRIARMGQDVEGDWRAALHESADRLDLDEPARLVISSAVRVPFACGFRHPTIVLPAEAVTWSDQRRRIVLLHELAHVQRRDMFGHVLSRVACAMYWFHPLVWLAARYLRAESERACDDLAIRSGAKASDYAQHLLDIVTSIRGPVAPAAACTMARRRDFEGRMLAILDPDRRRTAPGRARAVAFVLGLAILYDVIGTVVLAPRAAAAAGPRPHSEQSAAPDASMPAVVATTTARTASAVPSAAPPTAPTPAAPTPAAPTPAVRAPAADDTTARRSALLISVLRTDSSASLRKVAAWGLHQFNDDDAVRDALANALRHDADASVRETAAWSLEGVEGDAAVAALTSAVHDDRDPEVRATAAWSLAGECSHGAIETAFAGALRDSSEKVRASAAWALGQCNLEHAPAELMALLTDREPRVRKMATWALFTIRDPASAPALGKALETETDDGVRHDLIRAIAALGDRSPEAIEKLLDSKDPETRELAVHALAGDHFMVWPMPWPRPRPSP
jgi:beta-lactamase regulating signal transducer with metallopeptidase domain/HEAT repeat protein